MRRALPLLALLPSLLSAQVVTDTVRITVEGDLAYATIQLPDTTVGIGDSIQYTALAFDSEGDPVTVLLTWISTNPNAVQIDHETGLAISIGKGDALIIARAEKIGDLFLASFRPPDSLNWSGHDTIYIRRDEFGNVIYRETLQYCAFLVDPYRYLLAEDPGPPICPIVFMTRPEEISLFAVFPRQREILGISVK